MSPELVPRAERPLPTDDDRLMTEVDHLLRGRISPNVFDESALTDVHQNLTAAIQEQAMPSAVTETRHEVMEDTERKERIFMWMGKTAVQNAMSGYKYHRRRWALDRVDVEIDEAKHSSTMTEENVRVFISPSATRKDAPHVEARDEHLGDDDAVRVSWLETMNGKTERVLQSLLVKDVPFEAWVAMLEDSSNIFGKSITLEERESALSVMKVHRQLELPKGVLQNGPVSVVEAVIPYIQNIDIRRKVVAQARKYVQKDQQQMRQDAEAKADEWLAFEKELAESMVQKTPTKAIQAFIKSLERNWSSADREIIQKHAYAGRIKMSRQLAAVLESAQQRLLAGRAAVLADEEFVLKQVGSEQVLRQMQDTERLIIIARQEGMNYRMMVLQQNLNIASRNIKAGGGGCPGENRTSFNNNESPSDIFNLANPFSVNQELQDHEQEESDELGPLNFECTKGHLNRRPRGKLIPRCTTCQESVLCEEPKPPEKPKKPNAVALLWSEVIVSNEQFANAA